MQIVITLEVTPTGEFDPGDLLDTAEHELLHSGILVELPIEDYEIEVT